MSVIDGRTKTLCHTLPIYSMALRRMGWIASLRYEQSA
jgi:hypothetical protein